MRLLFFDDGLEQARQRLRATQNLSLTRSCPATQVLHHVDCIVWETEAQTGQVTYINTQKTMEILGKEVEIGKSIMPQIFPLLQGTGMSVRDTGKKHLPQTLPCDHRPGAYSQRLLCVAPGFTHTEGDPRTKYEFCLNVEGSNTMYVATA